VADCALVAVADDVSGALAGRRAERTIATDADVGRAVEGADASVGCQLQGLIDRHEAVARVDEAAVLVAGRAVVPVRAVQALVTDSLDLDIASVADSAVLLVAASGQAPRNLKLKASPLNSSHEGMLGMMTVAILGKASSAKIKVIACSAVDELILRELLHTTVAGTDAGIKEIVEDGNDTLLR